MAQVKVSELPAATSLSTSDTLIANQSGVTKRATFDLVPIIQSGTGAVAEPTQTALRRWCWAEQYGAVGDGSTDDAAAIRRGWTAGFETVRLMSSKNYKINSALQPTGGQELIGEGKSNTTLTLGADIVGWDVTDVNDTLIKDLLIVPYSSQTNPVIRLTAATVTIARNRGEGVQIAGTTQDYKPIQVRATGAFGAWCNNFYDISCSGVGTVVELSTSATDGWVNSNRFENFYVNDFIIGVDFVSSAGDGSGGNVFAKWALQAGARATHGFRIPNSAAGVNARNKFDAFTVYDLTSTGVYYDIGTGVVDTEIGPAVGVDYTNYDKFLTDSIRTKDRSQTAEFAFLGSLGRSLVVPTNAGWTEAVTGSGSTSLQAGHNLTRTGTTVGSTARRYTEAIPLSSSSVFAINFDKLIVIRFGVGRATDETNAVGRVQIKTAQTEGALASYGIGIRVSNYALYGESYGSAGAFVDLSTTLSDTQLAQVEIRHYPGERIEWWVDGVIKGTQSTVANIPSGTRTDYLVHSLITSVSDPSGDAQMFLTPVFIWVDL